MCTVTSILFMIGVPARQVRAPPACESHSLVCCFYVLALLLIFLVCHTCQVMLGEFFLTHRYGRCHVSSQLGII